MRQARTSHIHASKLAISALTLHHNNSMLHVGKLCGIDSVSDHKGNITRSKAAPTAIAWTVQTSLTHC